MEVSSTASTSRPAARTAAPPARDDTTDRLPPPKRHKPDIVAPCSPSKSKPHFQHRQLAGSARFVDKEQEARREASLLSFAEARAKASSNYSAAQDDADFQYPPGHRGDSSARGLLEQIKNRMDQRAPKHSNFLQKAKQVQQSLLDKQQRHAQLQKAREEAEKRESLRSTGFADQHAATSQARSKTAASAAPQSAFSRAKERAAALADSESDTEQDADDLDAYHASLASGPSRDDDLTLIETLRPGPRPIAPNPDDPKWEAMEPYSGHRLRERKLAHAQLKEHLRGRYHIAPSLLYSLARPAMSVTGEREVPVDGDWIVIATIVEKSELLVTKGFRVAREAGAKSLDEDDAGDPVLFRDAAADADGKLRLDLEPGNPDAFASAKPHTKRNNTKPSAFDEDELTRQHVNLANRARKFVVLKLVDLGVNSTADRGDNCLSLIAYESDHVHPSLVPRNTAIRSDLSAALTATASTTKKHINGSRGAFELLYPLAEGTVIAVLNPKVMQPRGAKPGTPESKMLRISPRCADDCLVVGHAADYRRCAATKANGQRCGNFVDVRARKQTRTSVCDFHLSRHMDELARGRPEFAANATARFGGASASRSSTTAAAASPFPGRKPTSGGYDDSAITNITTTFKSSNNTFARAALARKLNSSHGHVADGMDSNAGAVYVSAGATAADGGVRASDPSSATYDVSGRYGRASTEKHARLKRQIDEEQLMRQIEARFAPAPTPAVRQRREAADDAGADDGVEGRGKGETTVLPTLPNGTAEMISAAYSTLEQRKRVAAHKHAAADAKRRMYTGVLPSSPNTSTEPKLQFATPSSSTTKRTSTAPLLPIRGLHPTTHTHGGDSRNTLLTLASGTAPPAHAEPSLKIKRCHRPRLNLPGSESRESGLKVVAGELVHLGDFADDAWDADLDDAAQKANGEERASLTQRIVHLHAQTNQHSTTDSDSDLEII
ncbi:conserved hypothetical protein [Sporisorium reilianum SRZ2]|uniref:Zinc finger Mcm10/DnaG-type domain-containing protein n=1 Tax=Sporisorium reilianum (strain SRZ2) TaxID=999809 RepID=E6ZV25_SPORE|nr:conserved hypothetical protein [Sporisorium reilianum SRZ2]